MFVGASRWDARQRWTPSWPIAHARVSSRGVDNCDWELQQEVEYRSGAVDPQLRVPPSEVEIERLFCGWRAELTICHRFIEDVWGQFDLDHTRPGALLFSSERKNADGSSARATAKVIGYPANRRRDRAERTACSRKRPGVGFSGRCALSRREGFRNCVPGSQILTPVCRRKTARSHHQAPARESQAGQSLTTVCSTVSASPSTRAVTGRPPSTTRLDLRARLAWQCSPKPPR
jgi:hypothetical protein